MKERSTYLIVIIFLVIYLAKGIVTVLPLAINASKSIAWVLPEDYESEENDSKTQDGEKELKIIYLNDGFQLILPSVKKSVTQKVLRENTLHYKSICYNPSTPPPEQV